VQPDDVSVLLDRGYGLVLTTCTPPYSASHRLIVWAALERVTPLKKAATGPH
jgi:sortase (surface protein transpeptidase)